MAISTSTGFSKKLMTGTSSATELFTGGKIIVYSGTVPANADAATGAAVAVWTITKTNGTPSGLTFDAGVTGSRALVKAAADTWGGDITGTPADVTFFRLLESADTGTDADTDGAYARVQGTVGVTEGDFRVASVSLSAGTKNLSAFSMQIP